MNPARCCAPTPSRFSRAAGKVAIAVGLVVLIGWLLHIELLKRIWPTLVAVNPLTAICFVLIGIAFECRRANETPNWTRLIGNILALVVVCLGALKLGYYLFGWPFQFDAFLSAFTIEERLEAIPNQMSPGTALSFVCVGLAVALIDRPPRRFPFSHLLVVFVIATVLIVLLGYAYGVEGFTRISPRHPAMRLPVAVTLLILSVGILMLRPDTAFAETFAMKSCAQNVARRFLPIAVIFIFLLGWLHLYVERHGYSGMFATETFVAIMIYGLIGLIWWTVASLSRVECARDAAESKLLMSNTDLETSVKDLELLMDHVSEVICSIAEDGRVISTNAASVPLLGVEPERMVGSQFTDFVHPDERGRWESASRQARIDLEHLPVSLRIRRSDGTFVMVAWTLRWSKHYKRLFCVGRLEGFAPSLRPWDGGV